MALDKDIGKLFIDNGRSQAGEMRGGGLLFGNYSSTNRLFSDGLPYLISLYWWFPEHRCRSP